MFNIPKTGFFGFHDISTGMYVVLIIVLILSYTMIFNSELLIGDKYSKIFNKKINRCVTKYDTSIINMSNLRGENYWLGYNNNTKCNVTSWEIIHLLFHVFLGYTTNIYISQSISIGWEIYEEYFYKCGSVMDLIYNFVGFIIGYYLKIFK
jgi:hypothetical protein